MPANCTARQQRVSLVGPDTYKVKCVSIPTLRPWEVRYGNFNGIDSKDRSHDRESVAALRKTVPLTALATLLIANLVGAVKTHFPGARIDNLNRLKTLFIASIYTRFLPVLVCGERWTFITFRGNGPCRSEHPDACAADSTTRHCHNPQNRRR